MTTQWIITSSPPCGSVICGRMWMFREILHLSYDWDMQKIISVWRDSRAVFVILWSLGCNFHKILFKFERGRSDLADRSQPFTTYNYWFQFCKFISFWRVLCYLLNFSWHYKKSFIVLWKLFILCKILVLTVLSYMLIITTGFLFFKENRLWKLSNSRADASSSCRKLDGLY